MAAGQHKTLTIHRGDLSFIRRVDGEIVQQGNLQHRRTLKTICAYMKYRGYTIIIQKGNSTTMSNEYGKNYSQKQINDIDLKHYKTLREIQAGKPAAAVHSKTRQAMIKRGFIEGVDADLEITAAGLQFLGDEPDLVVTDFSKEPAAVVTGDYYDQVKREHREREVLRNLRDSSLALVESIVATKAPEVLPILVSIRDANRVLSE